EGAERQRQRRDRQRRARHGRRFGRRHHRDRGRLRRCAGRGCGGAHLPAFAETWVAPFSVKIFAMIASALALASSPRSALVLPCPTRSVIWGPDVSLIETLAVTESPTRSG